MQHGELRSDRGSWFVNEFFLQFSLFNIYDTFKAGRVDHPTSSSSSSTSPTTTVPSDSETRAREDSHPVPVSSSHVERIERGDPLLTKPQPEIEKTNKTEDHELERRDPFCSEIQEWLQEFRENLVDDGVPEHRDSHASSFS